MDPATLALIGMGIGAFGKIATGFMNSSIDKLQSSVASFNVGLLQQKAAMEAAEGKLSLASGALQQSRTEATINRTLGAETSKAARSSLDPTYGSPLLLEGFSAGQGATDLALIGAKAELGNAQALAASAGTTAQAAGEQEQVAAFNEKSTMDIISGLTGAATSFFNSGTSDVWGKLFQTSNSIGQGMNVDPGAIDMMVGMGKGG